MARFLFFSLLPALACQALSAPLALPDGGLLAHPRPADKDSLPILVESADLLVNGHLGRAKAGTVNGMTLPTTADGRFALRLPWPTDRLLRFRLTSPDSTWSWELPLVAPEVATPILENLEAPWMAPMRVRLDGSPLSTAPEASYWILPQAGAEWVADRREGSWLRLPLGGDMAAWVQENRVQRLGPALEGVAPMRLVGPGGGLTLNARGEVVLSLPITGDAPPLWREEVGDKGKSWRLILPRATGCLDWVSLAPDLGLSQLAWEPLPGGALSLGLELEPGRFQGHEVRWEQGLLRLVFHPKAKGMKGARILLDPGHGGRESGCLGASGTREKELALSFARELRIELERAGAQVRLTREGDSTLALSSRVDQAKEWPADLLLSLHYNSAGPGEDPWRSDGFMTFYWSPWAEDAASRLHLFLSGRRLVRDRGLAWRSLGVCRHHACPALLLELGSLAHPEEEARLLDPGFRRRQVKALRRAIASVLDSR